jgi:hypothetical protein
MQHLLVFFTHGFPNSSRNPRSARQTDQHSPLKPIRRPSYRLTDGHRAGRATVISEKEKAVEEYGVPPDVLAKLDGYVAAFDETISLARAHELVLDEMRDKAEAEWKKVKKEFEEEEGGC